MDISIREVRYRLGMSQEELASFTKISRQAISRWENDSPAEPLKLMPFMNKLRDLALLQKVLRDGEEIEVPRKRQR